MVMKLYDVIKGKIVGARIEGIPRGIDRPRAELTFLFEEYLHT